MAFSIRRWLARTRPRSLPPAVVAVRTFDANAREREQWRNWACIWLASSGVLVPADIGDVALRERVDDMILRLSQPRCDCEILIRK